MPAERITMRHAREIIRLKSSSESALACIQLAIRRLARA